MLHAGPDGVAMIHTHTHTTRCTRLSLFALRSLPLLLLSHAVIFTSIPSTPSAAIHHICRPLRKDRAPLRLGSFGKAKVVRFSFSTTPTHHARSCLTSQTPPAHPHAAGFCFRLATDAADHQLPRRKRQRHACSQPAAPSMTAHGVPCPPIPSVRLFCILGQAVPAPNRPRGH